MVRVVAGTAHEAETGAARIDPAAPGRLRPRERLLGRHNSDGDDRLWGVDRRRKGTGNSLTALKSVRAARPDGAPIRIIPDNIPAHIGHDLPAYAGQPAAQPADACLPIDLNIRPTASSAGVLQAVTACGGLLSSALATAGPTLRAWHWGPCDPEGFAAMGVAEILLHTHDITQGLSVDWLPPAPLSAAVLNRLLPAAPPGDATRVLLWCTGRGELDGLPRQTSWRWEAARPD
ncbi:hypothetical protein [Streptomyces carminius]|uniref:hypothetical protein n=1 Tax=Streptomyces carminius TaxID=2665496 RepID=UPI001E29A88B|nr:hypothetical protein [Streptomyces carminius]